VRTVGFIGTGHLAGFLIEGLRGASFDGGIVVSPRNSDKAAWLKREFGVAIATSNQNLVDSCSIVIASVLPQAAPEVLSGLRFRANQWVVSVMAGVDYETATELLRPARVSLAMMPGHANALRLGPIALFPEFAEVKALFEHLGPVHSYASQPEFQIASVAAGGFSGMSIAWMVRAVEWFIDQGLSPKDARLLVSEVLSGNAAVLMRDGRAGGEIVSGIATPGGITELGNRILCQHGSESGWIAALDAIHRRIVGSR
jgi:pyrroline-5-carboxylate reductase